MINFEEIRQGGRGVMNDLKRYVLTKDNRIIDFKGWTTRRNGVDVPFDHVNRIVHIRGVGRTYATYEDYLHTIKAQSDNVFDLIEVGDLITVIDKKGNTEVIQINRIDLDEYNFPSLYTQRGYTPDLDRILAIYKQNSNGDYIKAWEVKDNE